MPIDGTKPAEFANLNQFNESYIEKISTLEQELQIHNKKINELKILVDNLIKARPCELNLGELSHHVNENISQMEIEISKIKQFYDEKINLQNKITGLFKLDEGDPNHSIQNFFNMALNKLNGFAIAVQSLNTGMIAREPSWKDQLSSAIFNFLSQASHSLGAVGDLAFGAGMIIPLIALPFLSGGEYLIKKNRTHEKEEQFNHASQYFSGGINSMEHKNKHIAYGLAFLLQNQLRFCTQKGQEKIIEDWIYRLCYSLLKNKDREHEEIEEIATILSRIDEGKEIKHFNTRKSSNALETYANREWTTHELFEKTGIAYIKFKPDEHGQEKNQWRYLSCCSISETDHHELLTDPQKYGYLCFSNSREAHKYKKQVTKKISKQFPEITFKWHKRKTSKGPENST